ncbi:hypothetical protein GR233_05555, partial [Campylobacter jejuni]|nr:hypothetical protein [Campylobacter jejuni]EGI7986752.1 hypothetical protein [Campylobacter jejuni]
ILFIGYKLLFYTEIKNGYVKVTLRPIVTLNQVGYCIKEGRRLSQNELFERATKDWLEKLYNQAHDPLVMNADGDWLDITNCYYSSKEKAKKGLNCQFYSNGKQFGIDDIAKQIDLNKSQEENMQKIMQGFSIVRPFEEEKILTDDLELKYSLLLQDRLGDFTFMPYDIRFIVVGGDTGYYSKFGYSVFALMIQKYFIGNDHDFKFKKGTVEYWKNKDNKNNHEYIYYPITNCGEVEMRYDFDPPGLYYQLFHDMQWRDEWHR